MTALSLRRLFIANRGEIARRVIRTARRLGLETAVGYSEADAAAPFVREADQALLIGKAPARESYLDMAVVLDAARRLGCDSLHPGYGFLSENAAFAEAVQAAGLVWVGPPASAIRAMGLKDAAKARMAKAGVPTTPGYLGEDQSDERLVAEAARLGYPILIKAVAGGGGKGMRRVEGPGDFRDALASARREADAAFGDPRVLLEIYVARPRHIEVQVFADKFGRTVHLFERDCSLQRRHQKVIEEAPAPGMTAETREKVVGAAVKAAEAVAYEGAGTVEFIADASEGLRADRIWFMEMNTRLQVEHPVTEAVTGIDLVEWQLRVADGQPLPLRQEEIRLSGNAVEARLYAEAPSRGFLPSVGPLTRCRLPAEGPDLRVDAGVEEGSEVTSFYDPMIAKLIAFAPDRRAAARRLARACRSVEIWPVRTNARFLAACLDDPDFLEGSVDTGFIGARLADLAGAAAPSDAALEAAAAALLKGPDGPFSPASEARGFRVNAPRDLRAGVLYEGEIRDVDVPSAAGGRHAVLPVGPDGVVVFEDGEAFLVETADAKEGGALAAAASDGRMTAPMPGRIVSVTTASGAKVPAGAPLLVLEAMKMEHVITAPFAGAVAELQVAAGDQVSEGALLVRVLKD